VVPVAESYRAQLIKRPMRIRRLDDLLATTTFCVPTHPIAAIKLDVEQFEAPVLRGSLGTLERHLPFVMIEGANRDQEVVSLLRSLGYLYADRDGNSVRITDAMSQAVNGYWLHPAHMERYRALGLVAT
jgi:hypothetical protein